MALQNTNGGPEDNVGCRSLQPASPENNNNTYVIIHNNNEMKDTHRLPRAQGCDGLAEWLHPNAHGKKACQE